jgi:hypothetical protein
LNNQNRTEPKTIVIAVHLDCQPEEEKKKQLFSRIVGESKLFFGNNTSRKRGGEQKVKVVRETLNGDLE